MGSTELIRCAWTLWALCGVAAIICLVYDFNHARQIRKWLREDYGEECCQRLKEGGTKSSQPRSPSESGAGSQKKGAAT